jgi:hypothetical protein
MDLAFELDLFFILLWSTRFTIRASSLRYMARTTLRGGFCPCSVSAVNEECEENILSVLDQDERENHRERKQTQTITPP